MGATTGEFIEALSRGQRVIVIGGLAVIGHGFNRPTKDVDLWLDPLEDAASWAAVVEETCSRFPGLTIHTLPGWQLISGAAVAEAAEDVGMIRINGLDCPVDIFRRPNEFGVESFDEVYCRGQDNLDGTRLPDPLDLLVTKLNTGRDKDLADMRHLETVIRQRYKEMIPTAGLAQVRAWFDRYLDWEVCEFALEHTDPAVREFAVSCLREMANEGDPFSQALLENRRIPYSQG